MSMLEEDAKTADSREGIEPAPPYEPTATQPSDEKDATLATNEKGDDEVAATKQPTAVESPQSLEAVFDATSERTICAFGPRVSFFYYGGDEKIPWKYIHQPADHPYSVSTDAVSSWLIKTPYEVALSPHGAGYFAYASHKRGLMWRYINIPASTRPRWGKARKQFDATVEAYTRLRNWLDKYVNSADDIMRTRVVFGPEARYMAWKPDGTWIGNDLPTGLRSELETRRSAAGKAVLPNLVTFGLGNAWAALWSDGSHNVDFDNRYGELDRFFEENAGVRVLHIALNSCGTSVEYFMRLRLTGVKLKYAATPTRRGIIEEYWKTQTLQWSSNLGMDFASTTIRSDTHSRSIITPKEALEAIQALEAAAAEPATHVQKTKLPEEQAALLSTKSSKKPIKGSHLALGAAAAVVLCSVM